VASLLSDLCQHVESNDPDVLQRLLQDPVIGPCRVRGINVITTITSNMPSVVIPGTLNAAEVKQVKPRETLQEHDLSNKTFSHKPQTENAIHALGDEQDDGDDDAQAVQAFEISDNAVETVQKRCLAIQFPISEEYDFWNDNRNANLEIDLELNTQIRPYQEKSLSKMFGNGRANSGIVVLPCGAGKTLVAITAAYKVKPLPAIQPPCDPL
jgi:DNA excision repair protein ERCC-3